MKKFMKKIKLVLLLIGVLFIPNYANSGGLIDKPSSSDLKPLYPYKFSGSSIVIYNGLETSLSDLIEDYKKCKNSALITKDEYETTKEFERNVSMILRH
jgi:hypothetical protein